MMKLTLTALGIAAFSFASYASNQRQSNYGHALDQEIRRLQGFRSSTSGDLDASKACKSRYNKIFNKKYINVSIGFGYGDSDTGEVAIDSIIYKDFVNKLTQRCPVGISACGFARDQKNPDVFRKIVFAPTGENNYMITLNVTRPSLSWDGRANLSDANRERQMATCLKARDKFMGEVASGADIVFYVGHSRDGGGPDFCPAIRKADGHVNYALYHKRKEGITAFANAIQSAAKSGKPNQVVASFSCSSELHFANRLRAANPKAALLLTSRTVTFMHMTLDTYTSLDNLLHQRCADGFEEAYEFRQFGTNTLNMF